MNDLVACATGEMVIVAHEAKRKGQELFSEGGIALGTVDQGEKPLYSKVVSIGEDALRELEKDSNGWYDVGDLVLIPDTNRSQFVTDPRVITGELKHDDPNTVLMMVTHYKNITVVYKEKS